MKCLLLIGMCICSNILHGGLTPSDMSMAMFKSGLVKEPTVFKVMISVAGHDYCWDYQIDKFRDQFWAVRMRPVHSKDDLGRTGLYCYVKKSSEAGQIVADALKDGGEHTALVQVRYSDKSEFDRCCVMDAIEMVATEGSGEIKAKFGATRISVTKSESYDYLQGKIVVSIKSKLALRA